MRQLQEIADEQGSMDTIVQLTNAFEGLASMRIAGIKAQVMQAQQFFQELWQIYRQLRVDSLFRFGRSTDEKVSDKTLFILITAEGGFSGDIDHRLVDMVIKEYDPEKQDIIVIGYHGSLLLRQRGIKITKYYKMPMHDQNINVDPLIMHMRQYPQTVTFYQSYVSLMTQDVKRIEMSSAVQAEGKNVAKSDDVINEATYIFEPDAFEVVAHLERSMLQIALAQLIFDSKLAQYASRFRAMSVAKDRATDSATELSLLYRRTKREFRDERLKEIINGMKKAGIT